MVRVAGLERNVSWSQRDSNPVLHGQGLHLPVFAPFNLVSGGVVRTVSGCSGVCLWSNMWSYRNAPAGPAKSPSRGSVCIVTLIAK